MELPTVSPPKGPAVLDLKSGQLRDWFARLGQPAMREKQVQRWLIEAGAESFGGMTDLPKDLRASLTADFALFSTSVARHLQAKDDSHKLLLALRDNRLIECVLIQEAKRRTACISTQVGCGMGCVFCASGLDGVARNLTTGEILEQLIRLRNISSPREPTAPARLTHIVVMGMGEPLANLDNLLEALAVATSKKGLGISARHVTISTVGLPAKIRRLADLDNRYHLAVSLHAPNDALRQKIVPTNNKTGIPSIMEAADYYFDKTGRQVTYEYVLLGNINDQPHHARELAHLLRGRQAHVNLIPFNDVEGLPYRRPTQDALDTFVRSLQNARLSVKVRKRKGSEIDAACGQLRRNAENADLS